MWRRVVEGSLQKCVIMRTWANNYQENKMNIEERAAELARKEKEMQVADTNHLADAGSPINKESAEQHKLVGRVTEDTAFSQAIAEANVTFVKEASAHDTKFNEDITKKLKDAVLKIAETEKSKAELEQQNVQFHAELLETQQLLNEYKQKEDAWQNKIKRRKYHFDGVAPILNMVGIISPMCLPLLYFLVAVLIVPFLLMKFLKGIFGTLIYGGDNGVNRPKQVKGFCWTIFAAFCLLALFTIGYLIFDWLNIFGL